MHPLQNVNFVHRTLLFTATHPKQSIHLSTISQSFREATYEFGAISTCLHYYIKSFFQTRDDRYVKKLKDPRSTDTELFGVIHDQTEPYPRFLQNLCAKFCGSGCGFEFVDAVLTACDTLLETPDSVMAFFLGSNFKDLGWGRKVSQSLLHKAVMTERFNALASATNDNNDDDDDDHKKKQTAKKHKQDEVIVVEHFIKILVHQHAFKVSPAGVSASKHFLKTFLSAQNPLTTCISDNKNRAVALAVTKMFLKDPLITKYLTLTPTDTLLMVRYALDSSSTGTTKKRKICNDDIEIVKLVLENPNYCDYQVLANIFPELAYLGKLSGMKMLFEGITTALNEQRKNNNNTSKKKEDTPSKQLNFNEIFDFNGLAPIHLCLFCGGSSTNAMTRITDIIRFLVSNGADVNVMSLDGKTNYKARKFGPFHSGSQAFNPGTHGLQTSNCVNHHLLSESNHLTMSALHMLSYLSFIPKSEEDRLSLIKLLVEEFGADVSIKNQSGETPLDFAKNSMKKFKTDAMNVLIVEYLENKMKELSREKQR